MPEWKKNLGKEDPLEVHTSPRLTLHLGWEVIPPQTQSPVWNPALAGEQLRARVLCEHLWGFLMATSWSAGPHWLSLLLRGLQTREDVRTALVNQGQMQYIARRNVPVVCPLFLSLPWPCPFPNGSWLHSTTILPWEYSHSSNSCWCCCLGWLQARLSWTPELDAWYVQYVLLPVGDVD